MKIMSLIQQLNAISHLSDYTLGGKWLELLSEIAPGLKRAAIMLNPDTATAPYMCHLRRPPGHSTSR
jgi:hypothetical protein